MSNVKEYSPSIYGGKEEEMMRIFDLQLQDAKNYFINCIKPRLDRSYKLYIAYNGDRAKEIQSWQANIFVPYINAVVETLMPRILDARPEFYVTGRTEDDQLKTIKNQHLLDYSWEKAKMDQTSELVTRSSLVYGSGFLQVSWKKDVRKHKFLKTKDLAKKKYVWEEKEQVFYDAPYAEWVDNYSLWYDWHNIARESKQFWFKRLILTGAEIKRRYSLADGERLAMALEKPGGDLTDYASVRNEVKLSHNKIIKGADYIYSGYNFSNQIYQTQNDSNLKMYEVFEWWRPFDDEYAVMVNKVPILRGGSIPNPYNFKEAPFIDIPYLKLLNEFEGYGLPMLLENPQIMLNTIKNQRLDSTAMSIHKMWIVNPLANVNQDDLLVRPFGIIYTNQVDSVRSVEFSDIKASAYREEDSLKSDMRYASGVDDFSMGVGGGAGSATEVRHLRESTLERVRLYINHLGDAYATLMRYWFEMYKQFYTKEMIIRIVGEDGQEQFPIIEKDDLMGEFDFKASVIPSIAGKNDVDKKQSMDLFQLLINLPFVDPQKLTSKTLRNWNYDLESIAKKEEPQGLPGMGEEGLPPGGAGLPGEGAPELSNIRDLLIKSGGSGIPQDVLNSAVGMLGGTPAPEDESLFTEASAPINLLESGELPPTVGNMPTSNPRGMNRQGRVNTNIPLRETYSEEGGLLGRSQNIQR